MNNERPKHVDLFAGICGFSLAAEWAGFETICFCELDPFCQKVITKNFGATLEEGEQNGTEPIRSGRSRPRLVADIHSLNGADYYGVDLVTGGFPCQPFSVAGNRRGAEDDRALWPQMFRFIKEARPTFVLGENVAGIINMELDTVLADLEGIGYAARAFVIPACAVNAAHRRLRVFIIGWNVADSGRTRVRQRGATDAAEGDGREQRGMGADGVSGWGEREAAHLADANGRLDNGAEGQLRAGRDPADSGGEDVGDTQRDGRTAGDGGEKADEPSVAPWTLEVRQPAGTGYIRGAAAAADVGDTDQGGVRRAGTSRDQGHARFSGQDVADTDKGRRSCKREPQHTGIQRSRRPEADGRGAGRRRHGTAVADAERARWDRCAGERLRENGSPSQAARSGKRDPDVAFSAHGEQEQLARGEHGRGADT